MLYGSVVVLDALDGVVARARGRTSALGIRLDTAVDAAGLLLAGGLAVALGTLPVWFLAVYIVITMAVPVTVAFSNATYYHVRSLWMLSLVFRHVRVRNLVTHLRYLQHRPWGGDLYVLR